MNVQFCEFTFLDELQSGTVHMNTKMFHGLFDESNTLLQRPGNQGLMDEYVLHGRESESISECV